MWEDPGDSLRLKLAQFMKALQGLESSQHFPIAECVSYFLLVVTECLTEKERRDLLGLWFEGIPSVMAERA